MKLSAQRLETMRADVAGLARALRASGAPPERALVLVKSAVHELVTAQPTESEDVMAKIVRWFVENYYAA